MDNSIKIKVFRASTFLSRVQGKDVDGFLATAKMSIGSYFESSNSRRIADGHLTTKERELLLPQFVEVDASHPEFVKRCTEFYADIDTKIPYGVGLELEIGLLDNDKAVGEKLADGTLNIPIKAIDYLRYKHIKEHPHVALTKEEADANSKKQYYIFNPEDLRAQKRAENKARDEAAEGFRKIKGDQKKVQMVLSLLGKNLKEFTGKNKEYDMEEALRKLMESRPTDFIKVLGGKDMEMKFFVQELVNNKVLSKMGDKYVDPQASTAATSLLANSLEELLVVLSSPKNSELLISLKARLTEKSADYKPE